MLTPYQDWIMGAAGGALIGLAAVLLMTLLGRIAGISGIAGGLLDRVTGTGEREAAASPVGWRAAFVGGVIAGPLVFAALRGGEAAPVQLDVTAWPLLVLGGLLVGFGTRLGAGCTSGHGVCGLARLSGRSLVATAVFFGAALITVFVTRQLAGGPFTAGG